MNYLCNIILKYYCANGNDLITFNMKRKTKNYKNKDHEYERD